MDLNITRLANIEKDKSTEFLGKMDSKLMMDVSQNRIIENYKNSNNNLNYATKQLR